MGNDRTSGLEELARDLKRAQAMARLGSWRMDLAAGTFTASEEARRIYGLGGESWPAERIRSIPLPEHRAMLDARMEALIEAGQPYDVEFRIRRPSDGAILHVHSVAEFDPDCRAVVGTIQDITERKAMEAHVSLLCEMLDNAPASVTVHDTDGNFLFANRITAALHGYADEAEFRAVPLHALDVPESEALLRERFRRIAEEGEARFEVEHFRKDGSTFPLEVLAKSIDWHGRPAILSVATDITERRGAQRRLAHSLDLMRYIIEHSNGAVAVHDRDLRYVYVSARYLEQYGVRESDIVGRHHYEVFPDLPEKWREVHRRALRGEVSRAERDAYPRADGTVEWTRWECRPWFEADGAIGGIVVYTEVITDRVRAEEALRESEERNRFLAEFTVEGILIHKNGVAIDLNDSLARMLGHPRADLLERSFLELVHPEDLPLVRDQLARERAGPYVIRMARRDGRYFHAEIEARNFARGRDVWRATAVRDLTERMRGEEERRKLQAQLNHAQKMESVGRLAGGVAHDFNNMIGVILGNAEMALEKLDASDPIHADLVEVISAARRSAEITRQLLAFARKQTIAPKTLDLNATVEGMLKMLGRLIGEDTILAFAPGADLPSVRMDPSQIDQILANLCVNARDAIAGMGRITIRTEPTRFDEAAVAGRPEVSPGEYVTLTVSDTGCGMERQVMERLFEPFFTTKGVGKGTGLGLATVYGIVKQNGGFLEVESEPGHGSTFRIHLPAQVARPEPSAKERKGAAPDPLGTETVLLVEDEPSILAMTQRMLERLGYRVIPARSPGEALELARVHAGEIHLLMTDLVMPQMNGWDLSRTLLELHPSLRRLFMSGYTDEAIARHGVLEEGVRFLAKPFAMADLAASVRAALGKQEGERESPWNRS